MLSRGLIGGPWQKGTTSAGDFRAHSPRFQGSNLDANLALVEALGRVAQAKGITVAQLAIAWVAAQGKDIVPLVGARRRDRLAESLGAVAVTLSADDMAAIERAVPKGAAAGSRSKRLERIASDLRSVRLSRAIGHGQAVVKKRRFEHMQLNGVIGDPFRRLANLRGPSNKFLIHAQPPGHCLILRRCASHIEPAPVMRRRRRGLHSTL